MSKMKEFAKNNQLLIFVLSTYLVLLIIKTPLGIAALRNSAYYFREMLIIMPVIMLLTALLEAWVPKQFIVKHLGKDAGFKGGVFAFLLGSISAGPIYAAFPVSVSLLKKGASVSNIVILLSTWAVVKIPMLANEAKFLGPKFMVVRWIFTTISIFLIGFITAKYTNREEIMKIHEKDSQLAQTPRINADCCVGCGLCVKVCSGVFAMEGKKACIIKSGPISACFHKALELCPAKAISY